MSSRSIIHNYMPRAKHTHKIQFVTNLFAYFDDCRHRPVRVVLKMLSFNFMWLLSEENSKEYARGVTLIYY
jgi:hypothetical protein